MIEEHRTHQHTQSHGHTKGIAIPAIRANDPVLIFGGPYSNLEATKGVLSAAAELSIPSDRIVCTGDVVAYGADAELTVRLVRESEVHVVMGNCEESLAAGDADCGCGFAADSECQRLSEVWFLHATNQLGSNDRAWMAQLPRRIDLEINGITLAIVHGGLASINQFIFASTSSTIKREEVDRAKVDGVIAGHCGLPFTQNIDGRLWHNAGAIGMPANDGTPRGWFSVLSPYEDGISISHCALEYDHQTAAAKMRQSGLPEGYATALATGLWPNHDLLLPAEARRRGVALREGRIVWKPLRSARPSHLPGRNVCEHFWPRLDCPDALV